ncbi:hypothetical protein BT67DRAFT_10595 [Trichocladium antarcticum]|uniref:Uncharacterized protein n=1 Tax=Trichocladium antarcticum TaxID=1450529 RepID=A0AAN6UT72_9PEZI|nr:hypothetical protein BT67DRAFT_10595 [Trichocladium antarcticum]
MLGSAKVSRRESDGCGARSGASTRPSRMVVLSSAGQAAEVQLQLPGHGGGGKSLKTGNQGKRVRPQCWTAAVPAMVWEGCSGDGDDGDDGKKVRSWWLEIHGLGDVARLDCVARLGHICFAVLVCRADSFPQNAPFDTRFLAPLAKVIHQWSTQATDRAKLVRPR